MGSQASRKQNESAFLFPEVAISMFEDETQQGEACRGGGLPEMVRSLKARTVSYENLCLLFFIGFYSRNF